MKKWLRRLIYFTVAVVWLLVMSMPVLAVVLAMQREITIGQGPRQQLRLFLIQERDSEGVSVHWTRPADSGERCAQSNVYYLMWKGHGANTVYCQCYDDSGDVVSSERERCPPP